jgi:hypothetical protein
MPNIKINRKINIKLAMFLVIMKFKATFLIQKIRKIVFNLK